jgi:hypothetical protein
MEERRVRGPAAGTMFHGSSVGAALLLVILPILLGAC